MSKASADIKELQRILGRLARLDGRVVDTTSGPAMVWPASPLGSGERRAAGSPHSLPHSLGDPQVIIRACQEHGAPTLVALTRGLAHAHPPQVLDAGTLARAQRDIRRLRAAKDWLRTVRQAPRMFASFGRLDSEWLAARQVELDRCARALHASSRAVSENRESGWFAAVLELVAALRGPEAHAHLVDLLGRSERVSARRRRRARRALTALCARIRERNTTDVHVRAILQAWQRPSRRMRRRLSALIARAIGLPATAAHIADQPRPDRRVSGSEVAEWPSQWRADAEPAPVIERIGTGLLRTIAPTRSPAHRQTLRHVLAHYGLLFRAESTPALSAEVVALLERRRADSLDLSGMPLTIGQVAKLLGIRGARALTEVRALLAAGMTPNDVVTASELGFLREARNLADRPAALQAYFDWMARLRPHYRQLGIELELDADDFASLYRLAGTRQAQNLAVLAHCLVMHHEQPSPDTIDRQVAELDATLALFQHAPAMAQELSRTIAGTTHGLGARLHPEFARWLSADHLLDRYLHLLALVEQPQLLSRALLKDFTRHQRLAGERRYLAAIESPTEHQSRRLQALASAPTATPERTRRWLRGRIPELAARAYRHKLAELLRRLVRDICGLHVPVLTDELRDAVRFFLTADDNRALMSRLLRFAGEQPGASYRAVGAENQAWLKRARPHMDVSAWLAPRTRTLSLGDERYTVAIEADPLQVLRMGIPFGTCLALRSGENAAATVINALDANKQVLYVRDARGAIVGRKLCAVSRAWQLIGYRVYWTRAGRDRTQVRQACDELCRELASACGLTLAPAGEPEQLHDGFWYDDGPQAFAVREIRSDRALEQYCQALGRPLPSVSCPALTREARAFLAQRDGDVERALDYLERDTGMAARRVGDWLVEKLGLAEATRRVQRHEPLVGALLRAQERENPARAMIAGAALGRAGWRVSELILAIGERAGPASAITRAFITAAERWRETADYDDHGLEHRTMWQVPEWLAVSTISEVLAMCDRLEVLWDVVVSQDDGCQACRAGAEARLLASALMSYAAGPEPSAVAKCLGSRRRTRLARRVALHIAARFTLDIRERGPLAAMDAVARYRQRPRSAPGVARALKRLVSDHPELSGDPDLYAALIRHSTTGATGAVQIAGLPRPERKPFAALGPLMIHVEQIAEHLQPWSDPGVAPADWSPEAWELHYHRQRETPWRVRLRAALSDSAQAARAAEWLAALGEVELVVAYRARQQGKKRSALDDAVRVARAVSEQLADTAKSQPASRLTSEIAPLLAKVTSDHAITQPYLYAAWSVVRRALSADCVAPRRAADAGDPGEEQLAHALEVIWHGASRSQVDELLERAVTDLDHQSPSMIAFIGRFLTVRPSYGARRVKRAWIPRLWNHGQLRGPLLTALARSYEHEFASDVAVVERLRGDLPVAGLYGAWLRALLARADCVEVAPASPEQARILSRELLACGSPENWLEAYLELPDGASASAFLDAFAEDSELAAVKRAAGDVTPSDWQQLAPVFLEWLDACEKR